MPWPESTQYPVESPGEVPFLWMSTGGHAGGPVWRAGQIPHHGRSSAVFTVPASGGTLTLWYRVSSEGSFDFFTLLINGVDVVRVSGNGSWTELTRVLNGGDTLTARYTKDGSVVYGEDTAWIEFAAFDPMRNMKAHATLPLAAAHTRRHLAATGSLTLALANPQRRLAGQAPLTLAIAPGPARSPTGLGGKMITVLDKVTQAPLHQCLRVWLATHPLALHLSLRLDDGPAVEPPFTWENPNSGLPAVLRIDAAHLPSDGRVHVITLRAWYAAGGRTSPVTPHTLKAQLPAPLVPTPDWVGATRVRQNSPAWPSLVDIAWRATTAVVAFARSPAVRGYPEKTLRLGVADRDETTLRLEGVETQFDILNNPVYPVDFGVAGVRGGHESPIRWSDTPLVLRAGDGIPDETAPVTPDTRAGTARAITGHLEPRTSPEEFNLEIRAAVLAQFGALPANGNAIIDQALYRLFLKIKGVVRRGGAVTLSDLGRFEARWNPSYTVRRVAFVPSARFKEGTRRGLLLTDAEVTP